MNTRRLGRTGLHIAPLVLGGNVFGWTADEQRSFAVLDSFADAGFNAIDMADVYRLGLLATVAAKSAPSFENPLSSPANG
jgi:aryl-alcohol dehydrogenase-like predicted oxidoreductase